MSFWQNSRGPVNPAAQLFEDADRHHDHRVPRKYELFLRE
ncbi:MAG: hypothetical protein H6Q79_1321, partial [Deltaproteobacteria bacterium]|nr:hypothetical protein [Deltaproteobacteria bacterium]